MPYLECLNCHEHRKIYRILCPKCANDKFKVIISDSSRRLGRLTTEVKSLESKKVETHTKHGVKKIKKEKTHMSFLLSIKKEKGKFI